MSGGIFPCTQCMPVAHQVLQAHMIHPALPARLTHSVLTPATCHHIRRHHVPHHLSYHLHQHAPYAYPAPLPHCSILSHASFSLRQVIPLYSYQPLTVTLSSHISSPSASSPCLRHTPCHPSAPGTCRLWQAPSKAPPSARPECQCQPGHAGVAAAGGAAPAATAGPGAR